MRFYRFCFSEAAKSLYYFLTYPYLSHRKSSQYRTTYRYYLSEKLHISIWNSFTFLMYLFVFFFFNPLDLSFFFKLHYKFDVEHIHLYIILNKIYYYYYYYSKSSTFC
uniref:Uncharacterized protein n=1 Tax=Cacopsylla melanoneura TaxID=428564 RepID=A0A8D9EEN7_9HEMI